MELLRNIRARSPDKKRRGEPKGSVRSGSPKGNELVQWTDLSAERPSLSEGRSDRTPEA